MQKSIAILFVIVAAINFLLVPEFGIPPLVFGFIMSLGGGYFLVIALWNNKHAASSRANFNRKEMGVSVSYYILVLNMLFFISIVSLLVFNFYTSTIQIVVATILYVFFSLIFWGILSFIFIFIPVRIVSFVQNKP